MRFGIDLPTWGAAATPEWICQAASQAEQLGFDSIWVADHLVIPDRIDTEWLYDPSYADLKSWENFFEPLITLAYIASETRSARLGTSVLLLPLRNPVYAAKQVATLDALCGGRLILGVGVGWLKEEFEAMGVNAFERRGAMLTEYIRIMRLLWTEEVASFEGDFYKLPPVLNRPKPIQQGGPPIWIGGNSAPALRRAGTFGDGWHATHATPDDLARGMHTVRRFAALASRDPAAIEVSCRCALGIGLPARSDKAWHLYGPPESVRDMVCRYEEAGCNCIVLEVAEESPDAMLKAMELFADKILARSR